MPYDKDGKYYRLPTNSVNKGKSDEGKAITANEIKARKDIEEKAKEQLKKELKFGVPFITIGLVAIIGGCVAILNQPKEVKMSCTRRVGMDTRKTFDDSKFIVSLDESINGKGTIQNVITGQKQYVIFNDTYRYNNLLQQERNINQPLPKSIEDVEYTRLSDGRVLFFNDCIEWINETLII